MHVSLDPRVQSQKNICSSTATSADTSIVTSCVSWCLRQARVTLNTFKSEFEFDACNVGEKIFQISYFQTLWWISAADFVTIKVYLKTLFQPNHPVKDPNAITIKSTWNPKLREKSFPNEWMLFGWSILVLRFEKRGGDRDDHSWKKMILSLGTGFHGVFSKQLTIIF